MYYFMMSPHFTLKRIMKTKSRKKGPKNNVVLVIAIALLFLGPFGLLCYVMPFVLKGKVCYHT